MALTGSQDFVAEQVLILSDHAKKLLANIEEADNKALAVLRDTGREKLHTAHVRMKKAMEIQRSEEIIESRMTVEKWGKAILKKFPKQELDSEELQDRLEQLTKKSESEYEAALKRHDDGLFGMDEHFFHFMSRHYEQCLGIYLEKRHRTDEMYREGRWRSFQHSIDCFKILMDSRILRLNKKLIDMEEVKKKSIIDEEYTEIIQRAELLRLKFDDQVAAISASNWEANEEILEDFEKFKFADASEDLGR